MVTPYGLLDASSEGKYYGTATLVAIDANGEETLRSVTHNRVTDVGEEYLLDQVFQEVGNVAAIDTAQIGSICIAEGTITETEGATAGGFDTANTMILTADDNCIEADVNVAGNDGKAVLGPLTFIDDIHLVTGDVINGIGICSANAVGSITPYDNCLTGNTGAGVLFAVVNTTDVTINAGESVEITYTFDISSIND
ncbi:MAG: hypothetical protein IIA82_10215 [Thaumarchaeota archaeon]|nr:hypothetical protein [Nitrososphaerota archaeon]